MNAQAVSTTVPVLLLAACGSGEDGPGAGSDAAAESAPAARAAVPAPAEECTLLERFPPETPTPRDADSATDMRIQYVLLSS